MMGLGRGVIGGMRNADTWAYKNGAMLGYHLSVRPNIPGVLALYPLIYTGV